MIFQIGDNLGDFVDLSLSHQSPEKRVEVVTEFNDMWGKYWFMIENPTYGDWEGALINLILIDQIKKSFRLEIKSWMRLDEKSFSDRLC